MEDKTSTELILSQRAAGGVPTPGVWHPDFAAVKAAAEKTGAPLFAMWINPGCGFCKRFCANAVKDRFVSWMRESGAYFWLGSATDSTGRSGPGWEFVLRQSEGHAKHYFPLIAIWQCEAGSPDKVLHDYRASGRTFEGEKSGEEGLDNTLNAIAEALRNPPYPFEQQQERAEKPAAGGGCPGGHPHLRVLQQIGLLVAPFVPAPVVSPKVRFVPGLDPQKRLSIVQAIADNDGHCPCQPGKTPDTVCQCKAFRETGKCVCGLFERYEA